MSTKHSPRKVTLAMIKGKPIATSVPVIHYHASDDELQEIYPSTDEERRLTPESEKISSKPTSTSVKCAERKSVNESDNSENNSESRSIGTDNVLPEGTPPSLDPWKVLSDIKGKITKTLEEKLSEIKSDKRKQSDSRAENSSISDSEDQGSVTPHEDKLGDKESSEPVVTVVHRKGNTARYIGFTGVKTGLKDDKRLEDENIESGVEASEFSTNLCQGMFSCSKTDTDKKSPMDESNAVAFQQQSSRTHPIVLPKPVNFKTIFLHLVVQLIRQVTCRSVAVLVAIPCIYYVTPLPEYFLGFIVGVLLTITLYDTITKLQTILSTFPEEKFVSAPTIPVLEIPAVEEHVVVERFQGWVNELPYTYEPSNYHVARTKSVFFRLEGNLLWIMETRMKIPKKAVWDEPKHKLKFVKRRVYNLTGAKVELLPCGLARRRRWSKKYPICICLRKREEDEVTVQDDTDDENSYLYPSSYDMDNEYADCKGHFAEDRGQRECSLAEGEMKKKWKRRRYVKEKREARRKRGKRLGKERSAAEWTGVMERDEEKDLGEQAEDEDDLDDNSDDEEEMLEEEEDIDDDDDDENVDDDDDDVDVDGEVDDDVDVDVDVDVDDDIDVDDDVDVDDDIEDEDDEEEGQKNRRDEEVIVAGVLRSKNLKHVFKKSLKRNERRGKLKIFVFARADREKEDWYRRLVAAASKCVKKQESVALKGNASTTSNASTGAQQTAVAEPKTSVSGNTSFESVPELHYNVYMRKYFNSSCSTASDDVPSTFTDNTLWINCLVARILFDLHKCPETANLLQDKIQRKLSNIKLPYFMECLLVSEVVIGQGAPIIRQISKPVMNERGLWLDFDITYKGSLTMTVETKLNLMKLTRFGSVPGNSSGVVPTDKHESLTRSPIFDSDMEDTPETSTEDEDTAGMQLSNASKDTTPAQSSGKRFLSMVDRIAANKYFQHATELSCVRRALEGVSNTEIRLMVTVSSIEGSLSVNVPPAPSDRLWYGFKPVPKVTLTVESVLGERMVNIVSVTKWIETKLLREFEKLIVLPNMDDFVLPLCPNYPYATSR